MSIRLMTIVWDIPWPSQSALLVALKLADYANDEGGSIHPSRDTLAKHAHASLATVKRILAGFREVGLLKVVQEGGKGPRSTTRYEFNMRLLMRLHDGYDEIQRAEDAADGFVVVEKSTACGKEEAHSEPLSSTRGSPDDLRGSSEKIRGSIDEPRNTTLEPPSRNTTYARERASEDFLNDGKSEVKRALSRFEITSADGTAWVQWLQFLRKRDREDLAMLAEAAGCMTTIGSRWPKDDSPLPFIKRSGLTEKSERMMGG
jgi:hypothetical protein